MCICAVCVHPLMFLVVRVVPNEVSHPQTDVSEAGELERGIYSH